MNDGIDLDYNATTPCDPLVIQKMLPYFGSIFGNPSTGLHKQGRKSANAIDEAREHVANLIGAQTKEVFFTSGATESNNLAIIGVIQTANKSNRKRIITCAVEHKAVLLPCKKLEKKGFELVVLPVDENGQVSVDGAREAINSETLLVSIQAANNEIGSIQPIQEIARFAHSHGAFVHSDAAQAIGKISVDVLDWDIDLLSMSAHKFYGPKGIGVLYIRGGTRAIPIEPLFWGGGQEKGLRPGTLNVPAIVGLGEASRICKGVLPDENVRIQALRDLMEEILTEQIPSLRINGEDGIRIPNTSSIIFPGVEAETLIFNLPNVMMGTGSACSSGAVGPSHVLEAMGMSREDAYATTRISLGRFTTKDEIHTASEMIVNAWRHLRDSNKS